MATGRAGADETGRERSAAAGRCTRPCARAHTITLAHARICARTCARACILAAARGTACSTSACRSRKERTARADTCRVAQLTTFSPSTCGKGDIATETRETAIRGARRFNANCRSCA